ncbi:MAG: FecR family protein [Mucilaginibacter sp.]
MVTDRFIELLAQKLSGEIDMEEQEELNRLLNDAECRSQYNLLKDYWVPDQVQHSNAKLLFDKVKSKINYSEDEDKSPVEKKHRGIRRLIFICAIAAVILAFLFVAVFFYTSRYSFKPIKNTVLELTTTPSREKSKIYLTDGTVVTLNSETTLKYPPAFSGQTREVYLSGEAFFEVAKDHEHPFIVHAGKMSIKVLGTAFNVKSYQNDITSETTLIRGAIEVTLSDRPSDKIILKPNDKFVLKTNTRRQQGTKRQTIEAHDNLKQSYKLSNATYFKSNDTTVVETSWINNKLVFKDEDFAELANKMERWYGVKIKFKTETVKDYRFTGIFERESLDQALSALQMIEPFSYKEKNRNVNIY